MLPQLQRIDPPLLFGSLVSRKCSTVGGLQPIHSLEVVVDVKQQRPGIARQRRMRVAALLVETERRVEGRFGVFHLDGMELGSSQIQVSVGQRTTIRASRGQYLFYDLCPGCD